MNLCSYVLFNLKECSPQRNHCSKGIKAATREQENCPFQSYNALESQVFSSRFLCSQVLSPEVDGNLSICNHSHFVHKLCGLSERPPILRSCSTPVCPPCQMQFSITLSYLEPSELAIMRNDSMQEKHGKQGFPVLPQFGPTRAMFEVLFLLMIFTLRTARTTTRAPPCQN